AGDAAEIIERIEGLALAAAALHAHDHITAIQMIVERKAYSALFAQQLPNAVRSAQSAETLSRPLTDSEIAAFDQAATDFPDDIGVALTPLLDFVTLAPGEAVYLAPGIPHSYVLRLGLTSKPVFIDHALKILDFTTPAQFIRGTATIQPNGAGFALQVVDKEAVLSGDSYRLVVAIDRSCEVIAGERTLIAQQGQAVAITADEGPAQISTSGWAIAVLAAQSGG
ncbi:MAG: hypothetical protein JK586_03490, partial [Nocardiopsis sp. BM-2018]